MLEQGKQILSNKNLVNTDDVLFSKLNPRIPRAWHVINMTNYHKIGSTEFLPLVPSADIDSEYLDLYLQEPGFISNARRKVQATTKSRERLRPADILDEFIPLPPLPEQKRITTKIQELMREVERARTACEKQLEAAKAQPSAYLSEVFESEEAKKWERKKLGEVCGTTSGGTPLRGYTEYYGGTIPWVKSGELTDDFIYSSEETITQLGLQKSSAKLYPEGTLLIAMYGATVGKLGILKIKAATNQAICAIFPNEGKINQDFLFYYLFFHRPVLLNKSFRGAQPNISQQLIRFTEIPLPTLPIQQHIATELKDKMAYAEKLRTSIEKQLEAINALPQSILRKAFRGEL